MADPILSLPPLREVIAAGQLSASKAFGQNFLLDLNITRKIARAAGVGEAATVVEIGPGPGGLTRALLLEGAQRVVAVEKDPRFVAALQPLVAASGGRLAVIGCDALAVDLTSLGPAPRQVVANLPYNISTPILLKLLRQGAAWQRLTLMFQREVAQRITAATGTPEYGRLSVIAQLTGQARTLFDLPPSAFVPPPKVTSRVVQVTPFAEPLAPFARIETLTAAAFGQRRKMLRSSMKGVFADVEAVLANAGLAATLRAEDVSPEGFAGLSQM